LRRIGLIERESGCTAKVSLEQRHFIGSILADAKQFALVARALGIESSLHWRLDVVTREDGSRIRKDSPATLAMVRHLCVNIFEKASSKLSLKQKRFKAALSDSFRAEVVCLA